MLVLAFKLVIGRKTQQIMNLNDAADAPNTEHTKSGYGQTVLSYHLVLFCF